MKGTKGGKRGRMEGRWWRGETEAGIGQEWKARDEREKRERSGKDEVGEKEGKGRNDECGHAARQHTHGTLSPERSGKGQWAKRGGRGENRGKGGER